MKRKPLVFTLVLCLALFLFSGTALADAPAKIYVNGLAETSGDGLTAATPKNSLVEALSDVAADGTIVICGDTIAPALTPTELSKKVTITSIVGEENYKTTASLYLNGTWKLGAPLTMKDMSIQYKNGMATFYANGYPLVFDTGLTTPEYSTSYIFGSSDLVTEPKETTSITIKSGYFSNVYAGGKSNVTGGSVLNIEGGLITYCICGSSSSSATVNGVTLNIKKPSSNTPNTSNTANTMNGIQSIYGSYGNNTGTLTINGDKGSVDNLLTFLPQEADSATKNGGVIVNIEGYPKKPISENVAGSGTKEDPYIISSAEQLMSLYHALNTDFYFLDCIDVFSTPLTYSSDLKKIPYLLSANYRLSQDIDLTAYPEFTAIGSKYGINKFTGTFDGNNKTITLNIKAGTEDNPLLSGTGRYLKLGLFASMGNATVSNVNIDGSILCYAKLEYNTIGTNYVGSIVGNASGTTTISHCTNNADIRIITNNITMGGGGIAGYLGAGGVAESCVNNGKITLDVNYPRDMMVGGILGYTTGASLSNQCINNGSVSLNIINASNSVNYRNDYVAGGIAGYGYNGSRFTSCINNGNVTTAVVTDAIQANAAGIANYITDFGADNFADNINCGRIQSGSNNTTATMGILNDAANHDFRNSYSALKIINGKPGAKVYPGFDSTKEYTIRPDGTADVNLYIETVNADGSEIINANNMRSPVTYVSVDGVKYSFFDNGTYLNILDLETAAPMTRARIFDSWEQPLIIDENGEMERLADAINNGTVANIKSFFTEEQVAANTVDSLRKILATAHIRITADITLGSSYTGLGTSKYPFYGAIDGEKANAENAVVTFSTDITANSGNLYVGLIAYGDTDTVEKYERSYQNLTFTGSIGAETENGIVYIGALLGMNKNTDLDDAFPISDITVNNLTVNGTTQNGDISVGGVIGKCVETTHINFTNINVTGLTKLSANTVSGGSSYVGGAIGSTYNNGSVATETWSNIHGNLASGSSITAAGLSNCYAGGLVGGGTVANSSLQGENITISAISKTAYSYVGGLTGYYGGAANSWIKLKNSKIEGSSEKNTVYAGGLSASGGNSTYCPLINSTAELPGCEIIADTHGGAGYTYLGALAGYMSNSLENATAELKASPGLKILAKSSAVNKSKTTFIGGLFGSFLLRGETNNNIIADLNNVTIAAQGGDSASDIRIGGVIGSANDGNLNLDVQAEGLSIISQGKSQCGGIVGYSNNCTFNCKLKSTGSDDKQSKISISPSGMCYIGGLVGLANGNSTFNNCVVDGIKIEENPSIASTVSLGGLVGNIGLNSNTFSASLSQCNVINTEINSANANSDVGGLIGTLAGKTETKTTLNNANALNTTITADSAGNCGGLIGRNESIKTEVNTSFVSVVGTHSGLVGKKTSGTITYTDSFFTKTATATNAEETSNPTNTYGATFLSGDGLTISDATPAYTLSGTPEKTTIPDTLLDWSSSDSQKVLTDQTGLLTPIATSATPTVITAKINNSDFIFAKLNIISDNGIVVETPYITEVTTSFDAYTTANFGDTGKTLPATVSVKLSDDSIQENVPIQWQLNNKSVTAINTLDGIGTYHYVGILNMTGITAFTNISGIKVPITCTVEKATAEKTTVELTFTTAEPYAYDGTAGISAKISAIGTIKPTGSIAYYANNELVKTVAISTSATISNGYITATTSIPLKTVGEVSIYAEYLGDNNYTGGESAPISLVVGKANQELILHDRITTYNGQCMNIGVAYASSGETADITYTYYTDEECTIPTAEIDGAVTSGTAPSKEGIYYVIAQIAESANYNSATSNTATLTIVDYPIIETATPDWNSVIHVNDTATILFSKVMSGTPQIGISPNDNGETASGVLSEDGKSLVLTVNGLVNGTKYTFTVNRLTDENGKELYGNTLTYTVLQDAEPSNSATLEKISDSNLEIIAAKDENQKGAAEFNSLSIQYTKGITTLNKEDMEANLTAPQDYTETTVYFELDLLKNGVLVENAVLNQPIKITIPYAVKEYTLYKIAHLKKDKTIEYIDATADVAKQTLTFECSEFSPFTLLTKEVEQPKVHPFTDVDKTDWFNDNVQYVYQNNIMFGESDTLFVPYGYTTRGMMVTTLYRIEGSPAVTTACKFTDVEKDQWYTNAVIWASEQGIAKGIGDEKFAPTSKMTREEMVLFLWRYAQWKGYDVSASKELTQYSDSNKLMTDAVDAMKWAVAENIIKGKSATILDPKGYSIRAELAAVLDRFLNTVIE